MNNSIIVQKMKKSVSDEFSSAEIYYSVLSSLNGLKLTEREIQLIAFTAIKGNISNANVREEFCKKHNTTGPTINNIISKLKKQSIFLKEKGKVRVNPVIVLDFNKPIVLQIQLTNESTR